MADSPIDQVLDAGIAHHAAGNLSHAKRAYEQVLDVAPDNPDALHLLGVVAHQENSHAVAVDLIERAIAIDPTVAEYHNNVGEAYNALERFDQALAAFTMAAQLDSSQVNPWRKAGTLHQALGKFDAAARCYHRAVRLDPEHPETHNNLGVAYRHLDRFEDAAKCFRDAIKLRPKFRLARENLVRTLLDLERTDEALALAQKFADDDPDRAIGYAFLARTLQRLKRHTEAMNAAHAAIKADPSVAEAHFQLGIAFDAIGEHHGAALAFARTAELDPHRFAPQMNLGLAYLAIGETGRAIQAFNAGIELHHNSVLLWHNLAVAYDRAKKYDEAVAAAQNLVRLSPESARPLALLGTILMRTARYEEAIDAFQRASAINPELFEIHNNMASLHAERGDIKTALISARRAVEIDPQNAHAYNVYLMHLNCDFDLSPAEIFAEHRRFGSIQEAFHPVRTLPSADPNPNRPLRIGYLSPDFRAHSVSFFISPILQCHDKARFHVVGYDNSTKPDEITQRLRTYCAQWRRVTSLSDDQLLDQIRSDRIDILVDLAGHTGDNRLLVLARRAAPVQVTYLGYPNTTGLSAVDYRITDGLADPPGLNDAFYTEKLIRLPDSFLCYAAAGDLPPVTETPALHKGFITFGSFNMLNKINEQVVALWARLLHHVPFAQLFLKANGLTDPQTELLVRKRFGAHGIAPERMRIEGRHDSYTKHMQMYEHVDIAIDPFPYNGTTTTCEALTMGVPVVTLEGHAHVSRVGVSILHNIGLSHLIASTPEDYLSIASRLARDTNQLCGLRASMRQRMRTSPLMRAQNFTRRLEDVYSELWRNSCKKQLEPPRR